jgi:polyphenol oxidase
MQLCSRDNLFFFQFQAFNQIEGLRHGIFTRYSGRLGDRLGGRSRGPHQSFNIARSVGAPPGVVDANRKALADIFAPGTLFFIRQTHGSQVVAIDGGPPTDPPPEADAAPPPEADAVICDRPGTFTVVQVADCQAVLLVDPKHRVVANIHSGWRGSIANIIAATIATLERRWGSRPEDLLAGIGPSLGPCCGEFRHYRQEFPDAVWPYGNSSNYFNFWALSRDQLAAAGVPSGQIHQSRICTRCNTGLFYSYRASHETGRFAAVIGFEA